MIGIGELGSANRCQWCKEIVFAATPTDWLQRATEHTVYRCKVAKDKPAVVRARKVIGEGPNANPETLYLILARCILEEQTGGGK